MEETSKKKKTALKEFKKWKTTSMEELTKM
jgi:hypothetical protein